MDLLKSICWSRFKAFLNITYLKLSRLFVLANRQSGNSDGIHILSYFRRVLNPCQVLDLAIHSPLLVLKWCSIIPADVKFYILVAGGDGTVAWILNTINKSTTKLPVSERLSVVLGRNIQ